MIATLSSSLMAASREREWRCLVSRTRSPLPESGVDRRRWQGATTRNSWRYSEEEQRSQRRRDVPEFGDGLQTRDTSRSQPARRPPMATADRYAKPISDVEWPISEAFNTTFRWEYQDGRDSLLKLYAATQVIDEARHVEAYSRLLHDKFELAYPITPTLQRLLDNVLTDSRWDMTYLGMQVLIEGLALAAFAQIRDQSQNPLAAAVNAYVMQDEARHVAFGRFALRDYYPTLTQAERDEREEFAVEACYLMRDRFQAAEGWETLGLPVDRCAAYMLESGFMQRYRSALFSRIVPI